MKTKAASLHRTAAQWIEAHQLLQNCCILLVCLVYILPNVWAIRTMYYVIVLPLLLLTITPPEIARIGRSPIFLSAAIYFLVFVIASPFTMEVDNGAVVGHIRNAVLVLSYIAMLAILASRDPAFAVRLFTYVGVTAAIAAAANIWVFYGGLPPLDRLPPRLEGIPGQTMYYNSNYVALGYAIPCVGAVAAITAGTRRPIAVLLGAAALVLLAAVVLTQTRNTLIGLATGMAVLIVLLPHRFGLATKLSIWTLAISAAALVLLLLGNSFLSRGDSYRLFLWDAYLGYLAAHPWAGSGLTTPLPVILPDGTEILQPHNMIYHAALRGGVFAGLALATLFGAVLVAGTRQSWRTGSPVLLALAVASIVPLQMDFPFLAGSFGLDWVTLWLPIGLVLGASLPNVPKVSDSVPGAVTTGAGF
ncbi:O-antigen ligase family protein [Rhodoplanes azumiensis]|uniref:O-antigen ligase family protein n=1 Tax=Rhodoplanes azumiensis TaxID=1897628 RepID=A0ABW5AG80_9BRAD